MKSLKALASIGAALLGTTAAADPVTTFGYASSPQSFIGQGLSVEITPADGYQMGVFMDWNSTVHFYAIGHNSPYNPWRNLLPPGFVPKPTDPTTWWEVAVGVGSGLLPSIGTYADPETPPQFSEPFINFIGNHRASNQTSGMFTINEFELTPDGAITSFSLDFTHFGENNPSWKDVGYVRYNASPASQVPEPSTGVLMLAGAIGLLSVRRAL